MVNWQPPVSRAPARRPIVIIAALTLASGLGLSLPAAAFADSASTQTVTPAASPSASPAASPALSPSPAAAPVVAASPPPKPQDQLENKEAQTQLIGERSATEAHALLLEKSLSQAQLGLIGLGQQIIDSQKQVANLDGRISTVSAQHAHVSAQLKTDRTQLAAIVRRLYKHQDNFFVSLVRAGGFGGFLEVVGYSDVVLDRERDLLRQVQADDVALAHAQATLTRSRASKKAVLDQLVLARTSLATDITNQQNLQTQLQSTIDQGLSALDAMQSDTPDMAAKRAQLIKMKTDSVLIQIEQAVFASNSFSQTAQVIAQDPVLESTGKLLMPIPHAIITQWFGPTTFAFEASYAGFPHFHTGIDLAVPLGTPVFAAADGVVQMAGSMTDGSGSLVGYGNYIIIQHDAGLKTLYGHLLAIGVTQGQVVKRGQLIGLVGSTGNSTGPHTHFEVRVDDSPIDPMQFVTG